jgi:serine/threonine-protein kinase
MELLEGESLGGRLKRVRRLPVADAVRVARHALASLGEAHAKGVIHRDLKPDNLFLCRPAGGEATEICKLLDFGIAKLVSEASGVDALETQAGTVFGTPRYMSPEQAQGKPLDVRSDLYSLGVLLYQMLVGRAPFVDDDAVVVMARHIKSTAVPPAEAAPEAGIPRALSDLVVRALAKDPAERPESARAFVAELDAAVAGFERAAGAPATTDAVAAVVRDDLDSLLPPTASRPRRALRSRTVVLVLGALVGALAGALFAVGALRRSPEPLVQALAGLARSANDRGQSVRMAADSASAAEAPVPAPAAQPPEAGATAAQTAGPTRPPARRPPAPRKPTYSRFEP